MPFFLFPAGVAGRSSSQTDEVPTLQLKWDDFASVSCCCKVLCRLYIVLFRRGGLHKISPITINLPEGIFSHLSRSRIHFSIRYACQLTVLSKTRLTFLCLLQRHREVWRIDGADWLAETTSWTTWGMHIVVATRCQFKRKMELVGGSQGTHLYFPCTQIQRKLQLQVEEQSKYLEMIIAKQNESLKKLGAFPGFRDGFLHVLDGKERTWRPDGMRTFSTTQVMRKRIVGGTHTAGMIASGKWESESFFLSPSQMREWQ